jgi:hypothetical protein
MQVRACRIGMMRRCEIVARIHHEGCSGRPKLRGAIDF